MTRAKPAPASKGGRRELRIIGGRWRSRKLQFLDLPGLRPTPDRVRETLFNWLQLELAGVHVLDLFAGSGAMGFEALSRGAASLTLLERDAQQAACLREQAIKLEASHCQILSLDCQCWLQDALAPAGGYGLILLDPPFHQDLPSKLLQQLHTKGWLRQTRWVYVETEQALTDLELPDGLALHRQTKAGLVNAYLFRSEPSVPADTDESEHDTH
ncbi:MAG: 16S rRNA (guanine(966)-N(2))-methyltransferase RsmD [Pseudomonadota bacterium]